MSNSQQSSFYVQCSIILLGLIAFFFVLYIGQEILVPLVFAAIIGIMLNPLVNRLTKWGMDRLVAILLVLLLTGLLAAAFFYFLGSQVSLFSESFPLLRKKLNMVVKEGTKWYSHTFNVKMSKINSYLANLQTQALNNSTEVVGRTVSTISGFLVLTLLLPVYAFMMLWYKPLLLEFIGKIFSKDKHPTVVEILAETKSLIQNYLVGLLVEASIVAVMNIIALLLLGIPYAILIGVLGAVLNMIPYVGGLIAIALPLILALATKPPIYLLLVIAAYSLVQFIDNNIIVPRIVASKVKVNGLVSIVVVLAGGALWGISGMFLSLPLVAIVKVICDRIELLQPVGYVLGDTMPDGNERKLKFYKTDK